jgi:hypothetical protein
MANSIREQVLAALQNNWATYVERFHSLSREAQTAFLAKQGYGRLADLLAHVVAWWEEGRQAVENLVNDPGFASQDYDVDDFNARAVAGVGDMDESAVIASFEAMRQRMVQLVIHLPESAFENKRIAERLQIEVIGHLGEHTLPEGKA